MHGTLFRGLYAALALSQSLVEFFSDLKDFNCNYNPFYNQFFPLTWRSILSITSSRYYVCPLSNKANNSTFSAQSSKKIDFDLEL